MSDIGMLSAAGAPRRRGNRYEVLPYDAADAPLDPRQFQQASEDEDSDSDQEAGGRADEGSVDGDEALDGDFGGDEDETAALGADDEGKLAPRAREYQEYVKASNFPSAWKGHEPEYRNDRRMNEADLLTNRYGASDRPEAQSFQHPDKPAIKLHNNNYACVYLRDGDHRFGALAASSAASGPGGNLLPFIKVAYITDTQRPSIRLQIMRDDKSNVAVHIFGDNIWQDGEEDHRPYIFFNGHGKDLRVPQYWEELTTKNAQRSLFETDLALWAPDATARLHGQPPSRPVFDGISLKELKRLIAELPQNEDDISPLAPADELLARLYTCTDVRIYSVYPDGGEATLKRFKDWMWAAFTQVSKHGNHWFYKLQERQDDPSVLSPDFNLGKLRMPRWTGTKFLVTKDEAGSVVDVPEPKQCKPFYFSPGETCFPNAADQALEYRIAIERNRAFQTHVLQGSFKQAGFTILATFKKHPRQEGVYIVALAADENSLLAKDKSLRPRVDSRIEIQALRVYKDEHGDICCDPDAPKDVFNGVISADLFESGAEVVCCVSGPKLEDLAVSETRWVSAKLKDDATPSDRWKASIEQISRGIQPHPEHGMRGGVDIPHCVLHAPPTIENTDTLAKEFKAVKNAVVQDLARLGLNEQQMAAVMNSLESENGFTLVQGPPGCGKSKVGVSTAKAHIDADRQLSSGRRRRVLVCAPSNIAVDTALDKFVEVTKGQGHYEICRYRGTFLNEKKKKDADTEMTGAEDTSGGSDDDGFTQEMKAALWELADEKNPFGRDEPHQQYAFHLRRHAAVARWAGTDGHVMRDDAVRFLQVREELRQNDLNRDRRRELRDEFEGLEWRTAEYYLQNEVDIVFSTNSSSAHGLLRDLFQPKFLLSDEAAVTTLPDAATPMAAFMDSLEGILMCGDTEQQKPVVLSKNCNEFFDTLETSMFSLLHQSKRFEGSIVTLQVQHRMHPDISGAVSTLFYGGRLRDHPSGVARVNPKYLTLAHHMASLQPAWNGRRRLAIDVSGDGVKSRRYNGGTSWYNDREARMTVDIIKGAIAQTPPANGAPIVASDFLVLTPYTGQAELIRSMLVKERLSVPGCKVRVASIRAIQGEQAPFVILSMTRNIPKKPLSLGLGTDSNALNVAMSRPEEILIMLGNFRGWVQAQQDGVKMLSQPSGRMRAFNKVLTDLREKQDIVSSGDVFRARAGEIITAPEFPSLIRASRRKGKKPKRPTNTMANRPLRPGRDAEELEEMASGKIDQFKVYENAQDQTKSKTRRSNKKGSGGVHKKVPEWRGGRGGRGNGRGGRDGGFGGGPAGDAAMTGGRLWVSP